MFRIIFTGKAKDLDLAEIVLQSLYGPKLHKLDEMDFPPDTACPRGEE